jgi:hypothetical protein
LNPQQKQTLTDLLDHLVVEAEHPGGPVVGYEPETV